MLRGILVHGWRSYEKSIILNTISIYAPLFVVRFKFETTYDVPTCFIVQCTRVNGVSIAYYYSQNPASGWLQGDIAPKVGDVITGNSTVIPIYTIYQYGDK